MRIAFFDAIQWNYVIASVTQHPLGGTQSAVCYLAHQLSLRGHQVYLLNYVQKIELSLGVISLPTNTISENTFNALDLDFLIVINDALNTEFLKRNLSTKTKLILWTGHDIDQGGVQPLQHPHNRNLHDYFIFLSHWQKNRFIKKFNISLERSHTFPHCVSPAFLDNTSFDEVKEISSRMKKYPITLAYVSTPNRGLELLLDIFPMIRAEFPECRLKIFSSMKVYQLDHSEDPYRELYHRFESLPGVEYIGSIPQHQLASELKSVHILCYPNTFPETGCIAVMEAMASGCHVITSDLGALPETTAGFATLIPVTSDWRTYSREFSNSVIQIISQIIDKDDRNQLIPKLKDQIYYINENHNWIIRAEEWEDWLSGIKDQHLTKNWQAQAAYYSSIGQYHKSIELYELAIQSYPEQFDVYIQSGILLILNHQEEEAQVLWSIFLSQLESESSSIFIQELENELQIASDEQMKNGLVDMAITLRSYIIEFNPFHIESIVWIIKTAISEKYSFDFTTKYIILLVDRINSEVASDKIQEFVVQIQELIKFLCDCKPTEPIVIEFIEQCLQIKSHIGEFKQIIFDVIIKLSHVQNLWEVASQYSEIFLRLTNRSHHALLLASDISYHTFQYEDALRLIDEAYQLNHKSLTQAVINGKRLKYLLTFGNRWKESYKVYLLQLEIFNLIVQQYHKSSMEYKHEPLQLIVMPYLLFYMGDELNKYQKITNQISELCWKNIVNNAINDGYMQSISIVNEKQNCQKKIKIGYISHCLRTHSVGWLARHLISNHNRDEFEIYLYFIGNSDSKNDPINESYKNMVDNYHTAVNNYIEVASKICNDNIQILIDLDSITNDITAAVMCLKPAPIQITWLGFNASGIPSIDYFLVDHHVLPDTAQSHYSEKLWRISNSYLCVDGFEVHFPTLRRCELEIEDDAVIFLSCQTARKRHSDVMRSQLEIIRDVPNCYFLLKGLSHETSLRNFVEQLANEVGLSPSKLRFLSLDSTSMIHRANLGIADVILDTYPYNGATTTLEALWMGIPLVTRVGQQFAARNSYTFLKNAGIEEGIAWTDDEYRQWGIKFGTDHELRRKVAEKLRRARHSSPLWDAKRFTNEVEVAYQAMWHNYVTGEMIVPPGHRVG